MSLIPLSSLSPFHNSKLFFSKKELTKILSCYSIGVSKGNWKDYSINFKKNKATFFIYKHSNSSPEFSVTKYKISKQSKPFFKLSLGYKNRKKFENIEDLLAILLRDNFKIISN